LQPPRLQYSAVIERIPRPNYNAVDG